MAIRAQIVSDAGGWAKWYAVREYNLTHIVLAEVPISFAWPSGRRLGVFVTGEDYRVDRIEIDGVTHLAVGQATGDDAMSSAIAANTFECFKTFVGQRVIGAFENFDGGRAFVFEDGRALVVLNGGGYSIRDKDRVRAFVAAERDRLAKVQADLVATLVVDAALAEKPLPDRALKFPKAHEA